MSILLGVLAYFMALYLVGMILPGVLRRISIFMRELRYKKTSSWIAKEVIEKDVAQADLPDESARHLLLRALHVEERRLFWGWKSPRMPRSIEAAKDEILCNMHAVLKELYQQPDASYGVRVDCAWATKWLEQRSTAQPWHE